jgi:NitT/TauT family transport system ATP-binding protein
MRVDRTVAISMTGPVNANRTIDGVDPAGAPATVLLDNVFKTYSGSRGAVEAVKNISFQVEQGEFVSILGPSGCGKSTILSLIAGLEVPERGLVEVDGRRVTGPQSSMGVVFQSDLLLEWRTALGNVLLQFHLRGQRLTDQLRGRAVALLEMTGLSGFVDRYPRELSGGMRQRVAICRALVHDPGLLLMDEPFGALDALTREALNLELAGLAERTRKTVILITHNMEEAIFLSDRVLVLSPSPGRILADYRIDLPRPRLATSLDLPQFAIHARDLREALRREGGLPNGGH